jgi:hypothetical protein
VAIFDDVTYDVIMTSFAHLPGKFENSYIVSHSSNHNKKYTIPSISEDDNDIYHVYEHLTDITVATLCDKDPAQNCFLASCLDRECCKYGVKLFKFSDLEMSLSEDAPDVSWERYEYISIGSKNKLRLVRKCTKPGIMFNYFKELLDKFAGH